VCDRHGHPLGVRLSPGQTHESQELEALLEGIDCEDHDGEPLAYPARLAGDKAYRADWIDDWLLENEIEPVIPSKANEDRDARPVEFDREAYRERNIVERLIGWLKESRRVLTRFEKTAVNFLAMVKWACLKRYLRLMTQSGFSDRA
jgi:transposase